MRQGLRAKEEAQIAEMIGRGKSREFIYSVYTVWPSAIDACIDKIEEASKTAKARAEARQGEMQAAIDKGVKEALEARGIADVAVEVADQTEKDSDAAIKEAAEQEAAEELEREAKVTLNDAVNSAAEILKQEQKVAEEAEIASDLATTASANAETADAKKAAAKKAKKAAAAVTTALAAVEVSTNNVIAIESACAEKYGDDWRQILEDAVD